MCMPFMETIIQKIKKRHEKNRKISPVITKLNIIKMLMYHISTYKYDVIPIKIQ